MGTIDRDLLLLLMRGGDATRLVTTLWFIVHAYGGTEACEQITIAIVNIDAELSSPRRVGDWGGDTHMYPP